MYVQFTYCVYRVLEINFRKIKRLKKINLRKNSLCHVRNMDRNKATDIHEMWDKKSFACRLTKESYSKSIHDKKRLCRKTRTISWMSEKIKLLMWKIHKRKTGIPWVTILFHVQIKANILTISRLPFSLLICILVKDPAIIMTYHYVKLKLI